MPSPDAGDIVSQPLTDYSVALIEQGMAGFVAGEAAPMVPVDQQSGLYYEYDRGDFLRDEMKVRADGQESEGAEYALATGTYSCVVEAIHKDVGPQIRANSRGALDADRDATAFVTRKALVRRERRWADAFFKAGVWANEDTPGTLWDDPASTPVEDIEAMISSIESSTGFTPNLIVAGRAVQRALKNHADTRDFFKYTRAGVLTSELLASIFEADRFLVMKAAYNSAVSGAPDVFEYIGGKHLLLAYVAPTPGIMTPTAMQHFAWRGYAGANAMGISITREVKPLTRGAVRIEAETAWQAKLISSALGGIFIDAVA